MSAKDGDTIGVEIVAENLIVITVKEGSGTVEQASGVRIGEHQVLEGTAIGVGPEHHQVLHDTRDPDQGHSRVTRLRAAVDCDRCEDFSNRRYRDRVNATAWDAEGDCIVR